MNNLKKIFSENILVQSNLIKIKKNHLTNTKKNQLQTKDAFSVKWEKFEEGNRKNKVYEFHRNWFLALYGFSSEDELKIYLKGKKIILDAGCGLGYKAAWLAKLAPHSTVIGIDISKAALIAASNYKYLDNLYFMKGDISATGILANKIDFTICDQVIMHTEYPEKTFAHLTDITNIGGEFACYVYKKKALPRELLDDYFREATFSISNEDLWEMSSQLTELGKRLSQLNLSFESPDIPLLGIKGGKYDIQRFLYWNFIKCFWREDWGRDMCDTTNFDWYAPSNAKRFSKEEYLALIKENCLEITSFHEEESCFSGRFKK
tara:strand:+ start:959 stop:1918 length:960 start_codon:yes stop_codon:yes gene_type:complete